MAQRFGGKYSPGSSQELADEERRLVQASEQRPVTAEEIGLKRITRRAGLFFVPSVILAVRAINEAPAVMATGMIAAALFAASAFMLREGLKARAAYDVRKVARKPAIPRILFSMVLAGLGVAGAVMFNGGTVVGGILFGILAAVLHNLTFGIDPMKNKRIEGVDQFQQDRVAKVVREAETNLETMTSQIALLEDRRLALRLAHFEETAKEMIRTVEEDPSDLAGARKYLGVYLNGAKDATVKFVDLYRRDHDPAARRDYESLLDDMERNYAAKTQKLLTDNRSDMDIEIKVLRDRLQREGVTLKD